MKSEGRKLVEGLIFLPCWTGTVALFAWFGMNRLEMANETGMFQYLWHGIGEQNWPTLFYSLKLFLKVWIGVAWFMVSAGVIWFSILIWKSGRQIIQTLLKDSK